MNPKKVLQVIDLGGSSIDISIVLIPIFELTENTIPVCAAHCIGIHSLGILPPTYECRLYNLSLDQFPESEEINGNDPNSHFTTDDYLLYRFHAERPTS